MKILNNTYMYNSASLCKSYLYNIKYNIRIRKKYRYQCMSVYPFWVKNYVYGSDMFLFIRYYFLSIGVLRGGGKGALPPPPPNIG